MLLTGQSLRLFKIDFGTVTSKNEKMAQEAIEEKPISLEKQPPSADRQAIVALRKEVLKNLKELQITKKYYLKLFEEKYPDRDPEETKGKSRSKVSTSKTKPTTKKSDNQETPIGKTSKKAAKGQLIKKPSKKKAEGKRAKKPSTKVAKSKVLNEGKTKIRKKATTKTLKTGHSKEKKNPKIKNSELENIVTSKPKLISSPSKKQKEQINIIDQFIEADPKIEVTSDDEKIPAEDLSISSKQLNDELISENLAQIMEKQGKTQQAINIYKKLIWKFPQKKSYFAAQIDKIRKG